MSASNGDYKFYNGLMRVLLPIAIFGSLFVTIFITQKWMSLGVIAIFTIAWMRLLRNPETKPDGSSGQNSSENPQLKKQVGGSSKFASSDLPKEKPLTNETRFW